MKNSLPVAIIGGGPVGAAAAARLVQKQVPFILFEYITGDKDAAKRVELKLPETGVCKLTSAPNTENSCCS
ncbi:hypothetical protein [Bacillus atrophaeus]|uniref:hypothetical protein n=1 Tax=Bacillus atrophaeus TaxID=1452 RepID=UPI0022807088|nr:hypothetical protein [Bacillus atrophaeus]MCY8485530.1 hypothetical protein [Bacillus atrophaeus]MCY8488645.1 hypothetical protein [Bacillus atrophaeus]MCY8816372.1 hypothetical protein [Bacillus atrophaeus]MCY8915767.1 hypothetical protein [Bacillus atrophaeus]MCY8924192.1 hypothetical protein [Bacillus atrophaeus]